MTTIKWNEQVKPQTFWVVCHRIFTPDDFLILKEEKNQSAPVASFDKFRSFILDSRNEKAPKPMVRCKLDAVNINWDSFKITVDWVTMK